ncbi:MAG: fructose-bisphosphatase class III, partial [Butyricicoccus sp.]
GGRLFVIDGGISKAYQSKTGIAGYTLIFNSHNIELAEHMPFQPADDSHTLAEMTWTVHVVERMPRRLPVADTDAGKVFREKIADLEVLLSLYREGQLGERF